MPLNNALDLIAMAEKLGAQYDWPARSFVSDGIA